MNSNPNLKRAIINFIKGFKYFKEDTKRHLNEIKKNNAPETSNIKLIEIDENPGLCNLTYVV